MENSFIKVHVPCKFFASPQGCAKGSSCPFTHNSTPVQSPQVCKFYQAGNCANPQCKFLHIPNSVLPSSPKTVCQFFSSTGCRFGKDCKNLHIVTQDSNVSQASTPVCTFFLNKSCTKGDRCTFLHPTETKKPQTEQRFATVVLSSALIMKLLESKKYPPFTSTPPTFQFDYDSLTVSFAGTENEVQTAKKELQSLIEKITTQVLPFKKIQYDILRKDSAFLDSLQQKYNVVISHEKIKSDILDIKLPNSKLIVVKQGNICKEFTGAIVNYANHNLQHTGGIAKELVRIGGSSIQEQSDEFIAKNGKLRTGDLVATAAGNLNCKHIIHVVIPSSTTSSDISPVRFLGKCIRAVLAKADKLRLTSITFPSISSAWFEVEDSARVLLQTSRKYLLEATNLTSIQHVIDGASLPEYKQIVKEMDVESNDSVAWEWQDDDSTWKEYENSSLIEKQFSLDQSSSLSITYKKRMYLLDFTSMKQKNASSGNERRIRRRISSQVKWQWEESPGVWKDYDDSTSQAIDSNSRNGNKLFLLTALSGNKYRIDLTKNLQINIETDTSRSIRKVDSNNRKVIVESKILIIYGFGEDVSKASQDIDKYLDEKLCEKTINVEDSRVLQSKEIQQEIEELRQSFGVSISIERNTVSALGASKAVLNCWESLLNILLRAKQNAVSLPIYWDPVPNRIDTHMFDVSSEESSKIISMFRKTANNKITSIKRLQNASKYTSYQAKKMELESIHGDANEMYLFHGTAAENIKEINIQGFNRSFCGKNGTAYGQGVYFARDASYSVRYSSGSPLQLYVAKVLIGKYTTGNSSYKVPPKLPSSHFSYASVVDNISNPSIFVVFADDQAYPEYLVTFT